jgi:hypothetical protein
MHTERSVNCASNSWLHGGGNIDAAIGSRKRARSQRAFVFTPASVTERYLTRVENDASVEDGG